MKKLELVELILKDMKEDFINYEDFRQSLLRFALSRFTKKELELILSRRV